MGIRLPNLERHTAKMKKFVDDLPKDSHRFFQSGTPKRTGNARSKTDLRGNEIQGNYPYANRLNAGYSRQAPDGMTDPTITNIRGRLRNL